MANFFRSPVNSVNFGVNYNINPKLESNLIAFDEEIQKNFKNENNKTKENKIINKSYELTTPENENEDEKEVKEGIIVVSNIDTDEKVDNTEKEKNANIPNNTYNTNTYASIAPYNPNPEKFYTDINTLINPESQPQKKPQSLSNSFETTPIRIHRYNKIMTDNTKWQKKSLLACRLQMSKIAKSGKDSLRLAKIFKRNFQKLSIEKTNVGDNEDSNQMKSKQTKKLDESDEYDEFATGNALYRVLFMFSDLYWNENIDLPNEELYIVFDFLGKNFRFKLTNIHNSIRYIDLDFYKLYYIITDQQKGFFDYVEKKKVNIFSN